MQTSFVFNQKRWPQAGDVDDCWVISAVQAANVTSPWLRLVSVPTFRKHAHNIDVQGQANGGNITEIKRGLEGTYPSLAGSLKVKRGTGWMDLMMQLDLGRPVTVAIDSAKLPPDLAFGFTGLHQITLAVPERLVDKPKLLYANPLAPVYSRWLEVPRQAVRDAVMSYGKLVNGNRGAWFIALPTDDEALAIRQVVQDDTPFDQSDIDAATAALQAKIDAALEALD